MGNGRNQDNLDGFFKMIDSIEGDIAEILEDENNQLTNHQCLVVCFRYLKLYCEQVGMELDRIEEHYNAVHESTDGKFWKFDIQIKADDIGGVRDFIKMLEEVEGCLALFEKRCEKTKESFDEWNCVFILYSCLKKYCDQTKTNYKKLIIDVNEIQ